MGYLLAKRLIAEGHSLTILNRGVSRDDLPESIPRLHCDRRDSAHMRQILQGREFDAVVDFALYKADEAEDITDILQGNVGHYIFISTGQVYLIREGVHRPFKEPDYSAPLTIAPEPNTFDYAEWLYGRDKSMAEDVLINANEAHGFPYTTLRLPMVNSEYGGFDRLYGYMLRLNDGGHILVPDAPDYPLRHIYSHDAVSAIMHFLQSGDGKGRAINISQDETVSLDDFLYILGTILNVKPKITRVNRADLKANGFLPDCSPFSEKWMSELDNHLSKTEFGITYTPLPTYLKNILSIWQDNPPPPPASYVRRKSEKHFGK